MRIEELTTSHQWLQCFLNCYKFSEGCPQWWPLSPIEIFLMDTCHKRNLGANIAYHPIRKCHLPHCWHWLQYLKSLTHNVYRDFKIWHFICFLATFQCLWQRSVVVRHGQTMNVLKAKEQRHPLYFSRRCLKDTLFKIYRNSICVFTSSKTALKFLWPFTAMNFYSNIEKT